MPELIEVKGLDPLIKQMEAYPVEMNKASEIGMSASLNTLWEKVPPYPQQDNMANYRRTGLLGKSLGSSMGGGASGGHPSIYTVRKIGAGGFEGTFGTNLSYAHFVIGDEQAGMHKSNWWNIRTIAERAADKINDIWQAVGDKLAKFLEGKGA